MWYERVHREGESAMRVAIVDNNAAGLIRLEGACCVMEDGAWLPVRDWASLHCRRGGEVRRPGPVFQQ